MSTRLRRFEILLPLRFNDQQPVPGELISDTLLELEARFGSVSSETQVTRGGWTFQGSVYRDELVRVYVDVGDVPEHFDFFREYKELLKTRFRQVEIRITTYLIDAL